MTCEDIESDPEKWCVFLENTIDAVFNDKAVSDACCECGGGEHHSITPTSVPSSGPTISSVPSLSPSHNLSSLPSTRPSSIPTLNPSSPPTECRDEPGWTFTSKSGVELGCKGLQADPVKLCEVAGSIDYQSKPAKLACCVCMGGDHQSVKPSSMPTSQPTSLPSQLPSVSKSPSQFPSAKPSVNPSLMPSLRPSVCQNDSNWRAGGSSRYKAMTCKDIESDPVKWCTFLENPINAVFNDKAVSDACCECGGGEHHS